MKNNYGFSNSEQNKKRSQKGGGFVSFLIFLVWFVIWLLIGWFILFACNGGAGGSSTVRDSAWNCLGIYILLSLGGLLIPMLNKKK